MKWRQLLTLGSILGLIMSCMMLILFAPARFPYQTVQFNEVTWSEDGTTLYLNVALGGTSDFFDYDYEADASGENLRRIERRNIPFRQDQPTFFTSPDNRYLAQITCPADPDTTYLRACSEQALVVKEGETVLFTLSEPDFSYPRANGKNMFYLSAGLTLILPLITAYVSPSRRLSRIMLIGWLGCVLLLAMLYHTLSPIYG